MVRKELLIPVFCGIFLGKSERINAGELFQIHKKKYGEVEGFSEWLHFITLPEEKLSRSKNCSKVLDCSSIPRILSIITLKLVNHRRKNLLQKYKKYCNTRSR